jgi:hypothetical protein
MNDGPSHSKTSLQTLFPKKKFQAEFKIDSLDYINYRFEVLYMDQSQQCLPGLADKPVTNMETNFYIQESKKIMLKSDVF